MVTQTYNGHGLPYGLTTDAPQALVSSTLYNQLGGIREINLNNGLRTLF
ncbi:MAG: hypothetical protein HYX90_08005, partial [Chloroflexi bacterium]|nr:hypothetical protein [Chloroflexota bacterium]